MKTADRKDRKNGKDRKDRPSYRDSVRVKVKPTDVSPRGARGGILIRMDDGDRIMEFVISRSRARDVAVALKKAVAALEDVPVRERSKKEARHE